MKKRAKTRNEQEGLAERVERRYGEVTAIFQEMRSIRHKGKWLVTYSLECFTGTGVTESFTESFTEKKLELPLSNLPTTQPILFSHSPSFPLCPIKLVIYLYGRAHVDGLELIVQAFDFHV